MDLHAGITMEVKNQQLLRNLYVGIAYLKWPYAIIKERMWVLHNVHFDLCKP